MRRSGSPPDAGRPLGGKGSWRAPERLGGHERLIGPALELTQAVFGFPDHFFKGRRCRFVMYEITKSPVALQIALQLLPLVHSPPPADGAPPVQQQPRDRFRPPPLFDGCVTLRHQWEACARGRQCDHDDGVSRFVSINRRNSFESTRTGGQKLGLDGTQRLPSLASPPPGTIM